MIIPNKLRVGGITYNVIKNYKFKETELIGQASHSLAEIRLSHMSQYGVKYDTQKIEEAFIHEIMHCVDCIYNNNKLEEDVVNRLSQGLFQVLKDNRIF